jgi:hypothetical protein
MAPPLTPPHPANNHKLSDRLKFQKKPSIQVKNFQSQEGACLSPAPDGNRDKEEGAAVTATHHHAKVKSL